MATATAEAAVIVKTCVVCREDCSGKPRVKDTAGRYVCKSCLDRIEERRKAIDAAAKMTHSKKADATVLVDGAVIKAAVNARERRPSKPVAPASHRQPAKTPIPPHTRPVSTSAPAAARPQAPSIRSHSAARPAAKASNPLTSRTSRPIAHVNVERKPLIFQRHKRSEWLVMGAMTLVTLVAAAVAIWVPGAAPLMLGSLIAFSVAVWVMLTFAACERGALWGIGVFMLPPVAMTFGMGFVRDIRVRTATILLTCAWLGVAFWFIANRDALLGL